MGKYLSGSLDVGAELEDDIGPVIDETEEEQSDDFGSLIREELSDETPKKAPKEIKIQRAKQVPKVEPKKPVKKVAKAKKPAQKATKTQFKKAKPKTKYVVKKPVARPEPKIVIRRKPKVRRAESELKPTPDPAPLPEPSRRPSGMPNTKLFMFLMLLLIAVGVVYAVGSIVNGKSSGGDGCAVGYIDDKDGASLLFTESNAVARFWLRQAFETTDPVEAQEILHMLACDQAFLSTLSEPASYADCETPKVYLVVNKDTIEQNIIATSDKTTILSQLLAGEKVDGFELEYDLEGHGVKAWVLE